jgi:hypothetical protein
LASLASCSIFSLNGVQSLLFLPLIQSLSAGLRRDRLFLLISFLVFSSIYLLLLIVLPRGTDPPLALLIGFLTGLLGTLPLLYFNVLPPFPIGISTVSLGLCVYILYMLLLIDAELSAPPSEVTLFRDITLFSACFLTKDIVLECRHSEQDYYYKWLKMRGSWDYVEDIVKPRTENGLSIRAKKGNITVPRINYNNFSFIIDRLASLRR